MQSEILITSWNDCIATLLQTTALFYSRIDTLLLLLQFSNWNSALLWQLQFSTSPLKSLISQGYKEEGAHASLIQWNVFDSM